MPRAIPACALGLATMRRPTASKLTRPRPPASRNDRVLVASHPWLPAATVEKPVPAMALGDVPRDSRGGHRLPPVLAPGVGQPGRSVSLPPLGWPHAVTQGLNFLRKPDTNLVVQEPKG